MSATRHICVAVLTVTLHASCGGSPLDPTALLGTWDAVYLNGDSLPGTAGINSRGNRLSYTWQAYYFELAEAGRCAVYSQLEGTPTPQRLAGTCAYAVEPSRAVTITVLTPNGETSMALDGMVDERGTAMTLRDAANDNNWELRKRGS